MSDSKARRRTSATPAQLWAVLGNGYRYSEWVQGTKEVRDVDEGFPAPGTSLHYTVGVAFLTHKGQTEVLTCSPERDIELEIHVWPMGTIRVHVEIEPTTHGSVVTLDEHPQRGLLGLLHNPLSRLGFAVRTSSMLPNLLELAEAEPEPRR